MQTIVGKSLADIGRPDKQPSIFSAEPPLLPAGKRDRRRPCFHILPMLEEEARARQLSTLKQNQTEAAPVREKIPERINEANRSRTQAANLVGSNPRYISDAKKIQARAIRRAGELLREFDGRDGRNLPKNDGTVSFSQADSESKNLTRREVAKKHGISERRELTAVRVANVPGEKKMLPPTTSFFPCLIPLAVREIPV